MAEVLVDFHKVEEEIFWQKYPEAKYLEPFATMYNADKSKDKYKSSKFMWALALVESPISMWYNLPDKYERVAKDFLKQDIDWKDYESHILTFRESQLSQAERSLANWEDFMRKRDKYLKSQEYYFDHEVVDEDGNNVCSLNGQPIWKKGTAEQLDKAMKATADAYKELAKIKKDLESEHATFDAESPESMSDSGAM